jgi:agmatinase
MSGGADAVDWDAPADPDSGLFGFDTDPEEAALVILGVPWEPTVSFGRGTAATPGRIVAASHQVDLYDARLGRNIGPEVALAPLREDWVALNERACAAASRGDLAAVNAASKALNEALFAETAAHLAAGRRVGVLGGDHSAPLGALRAFGAAVGSFGILHIDAHHDLRIAYEGYAHSHASIMDNVLETVPEVEALVPVGVRDYSIHERERAGKDPRVSTFYDDELKRAGFAGRPWDEVCADIVAALPDQVYVSLDVDGLDPRFCPHTGTPVPGGLDFDQMLRLLDLVVADGRQILGFDLCEVVPGADDESWDLNVAARLLHVLAGFVSAPA